MKSIFRLLKSKTVWGTILTVVGALAGKDTVTPTDIMTGIGVIVGVAGARDVVAKGGKIEAESK